MSWLREDTDTYVVALGSMDHVNISNRLDVGNLVASTLKSIVERSSDTLLEDDCISGREIIEDPLQENLRLDIAGSFEFNLGFQDVEFAVAGSFQVLGARLAKAETEILLKRSLATLSDIGADEVIRRTVYELTGEESERPNTVMSCRIQQYTYGGTGSLRPWRE
jgi:hypothetical protein